MIHPTAPILITILLLSSALTITVIPEAKSQQFTTSTSILTSSLTQTTTYNIESWTTSTWTGTGTSTTVAEFRSYSGALCYAFLPYPSFELNSTGMTHIEYSVNGPMMLFIFSGGQNLFAALAPLGAAFASSACNAASNSPSVTGYPHYSWDISAASYPASGSFNVNLPPNFNPYFYGMICPESESHPTATLTISPLWGVYTNTATSTIPRTLSATSITTLTFFTTLEVPLMQTYGSSIIIAMFAALALVLLLLRRRLHV